MKKDISCNGNGDGCRLYECYRSRSKCKCSCCMSGITGEYKKIEVTEIPDVVKGAVEKAYAGQTIKEASVAEKMEQRHTSW